MLAVWACGKLLGARIASRLKGSENINLERRYFGGVLLMSCGFILMFQQHSLYGLLLFSLPAGLGDGFSEVSLMSRLQREPDHLRLPIFSFLTLLQMTGFGIGMLIAAPFYGWWTPGAVVLLFHGIPRHVADGERAGAQARAGCAQQPDASSLRIGQSGRWSPLQCSTRSCRVSRSSPSSRIFWFNSSMC